MSSGRSRPVSGLTGDSVATVGFITFPDMQSSGMQMKHNPITVAGAVLELSLDSPASRLTFTLAKGTLSVGAFCGEASVQSSVQAVRLNPAGWCEIRESRSLQLPEVSMNLQPWLDAARDAARAAGDIIEFYRMRGVAEERKADNSPVTLADREAEKAIRSILAEACPEHGFIGEEFGAEQATADYVWLIDPLDGTKSFVRGYPFYSTQIALMKENRILVAVSSAPAFHEEAWATFGGGAFLNDQPLRVSAIDALNEATLSTGNLASLSRNASSWQAYAELVQQTHRTRGYGDFYHYHLLASGKLDIVFESDVNILDVAALSLVVEEAGGKFTTLSGGAIHTGMRTVLASNGRLHDEILRRLNWRDEIQPG